MHRPFSHTIIAILHYSNDMGLVILAISLMLFHEVFSKKASVMGNRLTGTHEGYSAICAVAKNENRYIREWALYHICLGE